MILRIERSGACFEPNRVGVGNPFPLKETKPRGQERKPNMAEQDKEKEEAKSADFPAKELQEKDLDKISGGAIEAYVDFVGQKSSPPPEKK